MDTCQTTAIIDVQNKNLTQTQILAAVAALDRKQIANVVVTNIFDVEGDDKVLQGRSRIDKAINLIDKRAGNAVEAADAYTEEEGDSYVIAETDGTCYHIQMKA